MTAISKSIFKSIIFHMIPLKNTIMFESRPDLSDNTKSVFDEMLRRGMNMKYRMIWVMNNPIPNGLPNIHNVSYVDSRNANLVRFHKYTAKAIICCNTIIASVKKKQSSYYLAHGTAIKDCRGDIVLPKEISYCLCAAPTLTDLCEYSFSVPQHKIIPLGFPRNDVLTQPPKDLKPLFPDIAFEKCIVWYPTFRQGIAGQRNSTITLPILHDANAAIRLNQAAAENDVLIILKPHFGQDTRFIRDLSLSNIKFIDDSFFLKNNISSYEFVGSCDALITDYSSIYYDYTLCDKPIALIWEDYEEYKKMRGFAPGVEEYLAGGEKLYTLEDLIGFIERVSKNIDTLRVQRNTVCDIVNYSRDGKNAERVVDFIIQSANL